MVILSMETLFGILCSSIAAYILSEVRIVREGLLDLKIELLEIKKFIPKRKIDRTEEEEDSKMS